MKIPIFHVSSIECSTSYVIHSQAQMTGPDFHGVGLCCGGVVYRRICIPSAPSNQEGINLVRCSVYSLLFTPVHRPSLKSLVSRCLAVSSMPPTTLCDGSWVSIIRGSPLHRGVLVAISVSAVFAPQRLTPGCAPSIELSHIAQHYQPFRVRTFTTPPLCSPCAPHSAR